MLYSDFLKETAISASSSGTTTPTDMELDPACTKAEDDGLWFEDGNLILQAEHTLFRIYRGLLCARSSVFGDMFAFPPPAEGNATVDGCPIVNTYDSAQDMTFFLKALLDSDFFAPPPSPTTMPIVEGVLRLATKYDVRHLRLRAMEHLLTTYPTTLDGWRNRDARRTIPSVENTPFVVLNLAREFDMPWLVPSVAYCISSHDISKTLDGAEWKGRTGARAWAEGSSRSTGKAREGEEEGGLVKLTWADQKMCIVGRNNILLKQNQQALAMARGFRRPSQQNANAANPNPNPNPAVQIPINVPPAAGLPVQIPINAPAPGIATPNGAPANVNLAGAGAILAQPGIPAPAPVPVAVPGPLPPPPHLAHLAPPAPVASVVPADPGCSSPQQCSHTRFRCAEILTRWGTAGFLDFFDEQQSAFAPGLCQLCLGEMGEWWREKGEEMWEALPGAFGIEGGWEAVEGERERVMGRE